MEDPTSRLPGSSSNVGNNMMMGIIMLVYTLYMGKRAPIYRAGKAVDLLCAGSTARLQPRSSIDDMFWTWICDIRYTTCPKNLSHVRRTCHMSYRYGDMLSCVKKYGLSSKRYIFRRLSAILSSDFVSRSCGQILSSDSVLRFCLLKVSKYFYRAVCKNNTRTRVGD
jgi:hypothetical protein